MTIPMPRGFFRARSGGARGEEARACLKTHGLSDDAGDAARRTEDDWASRFGAAACELGPLFRVFARHLARRADLLTVSQCWALLRAVPEPMPNEYVLGPEDLLRLLRQEIGPRPTPWREIDPHPFRVGPLHQDHRAILETGEPAVVRCTRSDLAARVEDDLRAFVSCERFLPRAPGERGRPEAALPMEEIADALRDEIDQRLDLRRQADFLAVLAEEAQRSDALIIPSLAREFSTARVLILEALNGTPVAELSAAGLAADHAFDLGRRMSFVWMQQALTGSLYPLEAEVLELADGRLAWTCGVFAANDDSTRQLHWRYLRAVAAHDPDAATECLLREIELPGARGGFDESLLRTRIRQVLPVSGSGLEADRWGRGAEGLAEYVLLHWQTLAAGRVRLRRPLAEFYRGFFEIARSVRTAAKADGCLDAGLKDLSWLAGWNQFRQFTAPTRLGPLLESSLWSLSDLPAQVDQVLEQTGSGGGFRVRLAGPSRAAGRRRNLATAAAVLLIVLFALALAGRRVVETAWAGGGETLLTGLFTVFGCFLLFLLHRLAR